MRSGWILIWILGSAAALGGAASRDTKKAQYAFNPALTLDDAVNYSVQHNPSIIVAEQEIQRTEGLIIQVRAEALPHLNLTGDFTQQDRSLIGGGGGGSSLANSGNGIGTSAASTTGVTSSTPASTSGTTASSTAGTTTTSGGSGLQNRSWNVTIEATQLLYSGGQVSAALKIAKLTKDNSFFTLRDTVDSVIDNVRKQFYIVLLDRELIKVQEESVRLLRDQLKDQQNRFEAGTVPRFNVLQAEVALINQEPVLIQTKNNYRVAELTLAKLMNIDFDQSRPDYVPFYAVGNLMVHDQVFDLNKALTEAKAHRWSLKVQRQSILIDVQNIKVQLAGYQPRLNADAGYEVRNNSLSKELNETVEGYFFGVTGTWAIFDGGATYGLVKQARAQLEEARANYDDAVHLVELQVQQAYLAIEVSRETLQSQRKGVEEAIEALRLANERLAAGAGTQLDVLNSQVALTTARSTELQARASYLEALADFDLVTAVETNWAEWFDDPMTRRERWGIKKVKDTGTAAGDVLRDGRKRPRAN